MSAVRILTLDDNVDEPKFKDDDGGGSEDFDSITIIKADNGYFIEISSLSGLVQRVVYNEKSELMVDLGMIL